MYVRCRSLPVTKLFIPALAGSRKVLMQPFTIQDFFGKMPVRLGVGKNMARSIHWCNAFKVLAEEVSNQKARTEQPTDFGCKLLSDDGWDPFLEDPSCGYCTGICYHLPAMPLPGISFNYFRSVEFSVTTYLLLFVITEIACQSQPQILP